jgi:hypothetical protein
MKDKEEGGNCFRLKETKETWRLSVIHNPEFSFPKRRLQEWLKLQNICLASVKPRVQIPEPHTQTHTQT